MKRATPGWSCNWKAKKRGGRRKSSDHSARVQEKLRNYASNRASEIDLPLDAINVLRLRDFRANRIGGQIAETSCANSGRRKGVQGDHDAASKWNVHAEFPLIRSFELLTFVIRTRETTRFIISFFWQWERKTPQGDSRRTTKRSREMGEDSCSNPYSVSQLAWATCGSDNRA
jgi:hypothetical protein